jgi:DNA-directed RNA polymerase subunit K/omega
MTVKPIDLGAYLTGEKNLYEAIIIMSKRARLIHNEVKVELNKRLETLAQITKVEGETEDDPDAPPNPDQSKLSLEFETRPKPTEVALKEYSNEELEWRYKEEPSILSLKKTSDSDTE